MWHTNQWRDAGWERAAADCLPALDVFPRSDACGTMAFVGEVSALLICEQ